MLSQMAALSYRHENPERRKKYAPITGHITNDNDRRIVESLCENQIIHMQCMDEATLATDIALFQKYAFKVIPRVYPSMFVKDLISIQPIPLPTAKVFYKDFIRDPSGTTLNSRANFDRTYANRSTELTAPAKLKMSLTSADITATTKALQYEFSVELNQDLMAYHGISADPELGAAAAVEVQREIEYDIINTLLTGAGAGNVNWSATPPVVDNKSIDILAYNKTLFNAIIDARNLVFKQRYAYPDWLICGPDFAVRLEKIQGFEYDKSYEPGMLTQGRQFFGTIRNIQRIFVDPWFPDANKAVLGFKGASDWDVGCVYSPYIPFYSTQPFEDPKTLGISRALMSRQAVSLLVPEMYSTVTITNAS